MRRLVFLSAIVFVVSSLSALAQGAPINAALKANVQDGFIRLVFSGENLPKATVTKSGDDALKVVFAQAVNVSNIGPVDGITPATSVSAAGADTYTIKTGAMARHRTLTLGNRLFVDIYTNAAPKEMVAAAPVKTPEPKAELKTEPKKIVEAAPKPAPEKALEPKVVAVIPAPILTPVTPAPAPAPKQVSAPDLAKTEASSGDAVAAAIAAAKAAAGAPVKTAPAKTNEPKAAEKPIEKTPEKVAETPTEKPAEKLPEPPVEKPADKPADISKSLVAETNETPPAALSPKPDNAASSNAAQAAMNASVPAAPEAPVTLTPVASATPAAAPFTGSALITIGSTQGLALAAFVRSGYLWIVLSQEQLSVPPQVSGPNAAALGPVDLIKIDGGSAYRVKLPEGAYVRPEGAGLVWRLYIQGVKPDLKSTTADRDFSNTAEGPQVHIPISNAISALRLPDPLIGDDLAVITVGRAENRLINSDSYVDFDLLPAIVGAVIRPKADGIRISVLPTEVMIARQGGLRMSAAGPNRTGGSAPKTDEVDADAPPKEKAPPPPSTMFAFKDWALGGPKQFIDMRHTIDEKVATAPEDRKLPEIISGAKFMLAQGMPQEATGFMSMALGFMPDLRNSPDFQAISGAVSALKGDTDDAMAAFNAPGLQNNDEITMWKAFTLAQSGKLPEAQKMIPDNAPRILGTYPARLQTMIIPPLVEAILARGDVNVADTLVDMYDKASDQAVSLDRDNAIAYFRGRIATLRGDTDAANEFYRQAADGIQGPYPVRATLALVERGLSAKTIGRDEAIRKLERFRYGWRGDNLESDMLERLGLIYVTGGEQRRGMTILRDAATMTQDPVEREKLVAVMQKAFRELFSGKTKERMSPLEAAAVAAEFNELMPAGADGEMITMAIADQMVQVDLLERAANLIEPMVVNTPNLADAVRYAQRAAAIRILNDQPDDALKIVDKALSRPDAAAAKAISDTDIKRFALLRAKAKAQLKRPDEALAELAVVPEDIESLKLTADISWGAQRWQIAADSFGKLVRAANLSATRPPTHEQAQLVLNEALALNLSGDTTRLEALRVAYSDIMRRSDLGQPFQLVTRTAQEASLADRQTLLKLVSEVDMFKDVLKAYETPATPAPAPAAKMAPAPAASDAAKPAADAAKPADTAKEAPKEGEKPAGQADQKPLEPGQAAEKK